MWLGLAAGFLGIGMLVMLGGVLVVVRALLWRPAPKRAARRLVTPEGPAARAQAPVAPSAAPTKLEPGRSPTLVPVSQPAEEPWAEEVPTAVFRPSDYKDIDALMADADKYVDTHRSRS